MPENAVDAVAFYVVLGIFAVIVGNLIYESYITQWISERKKQCLELCCKEDNLNE
jgi:hypothetical protein